MSDNDQEVSKGSPEHGFLQWWIGTKRFIFVAVAFLLTVGLEMWWFVLTANKELNESAGIWAEILVYLVGLARGVAWGSMALLGHWFIGYGFKEGRNMVSEVFNGRRFLAGEAKGVSKTNVAWRGWVERKARAEKQGVAFDEPAPDQA